MSDRVGSDRAGPVLEDKNVHRRFAWVRKDLRNRPPLTQRAQGRASLLILIVILAGWVVLFTASGALTSGPSGKGLGGDFAIIFAASHVMQHGGNPYDQHAVYREEKSLLGNEHIPVPRFQPFIRVGNPPLFFWVLEPLDGLPFHTAALVWLATMELLILSAGGLLVHAMNWRRQAAPLLVFALMPQTILAAYYGNVDGLVLGGLAGGVLLARRSPLLAGCLLALAWLKPPVALPLALLVILFGRDRMKLAAGMAVSTLALTGLTLATTGTRDIGYWWTALTGYTRQIAVQPDLASLSGLYVYWASSPLRTVFEISLAGTALGLTAWWWISTRGTEALLPMTSAWLWFVWYLAAPFAHYHDQVLLVIPVIGLLGVAGAELGRPSRIAILYLLLLSLLLFPTSRLHTEVQSLALIPVAAIAFMSNAKMCVQTAV